ncbi:MAG: hypothetical protein ACPF9L_01795 [Candidatus Poseidoniaceae archaeon]
MSATRRTAFSIVGLMLISILASFGGLIAENQNTTLELMEEPIQFEATSPGHPVFAEYMGAHWCGPCITATNNLKNLYSTNGGGGTQSSDFTFVSFWESQTTGWPSDSPINRRSHIQNAPGYSGGIPVTVFGDAASGTYYTVGGQNYDSFYQNGGNMLNANDYSLSVIQSENGNNMDIEITAAYTGSGTKTVYLYAAVTEEKGYEPYTAGSGSDHPPHLWKKWLLNNGNNGFESFTLTSGSPVTKSWTVPTSTARAVSGISSADNFLTVAALLDGDHTNHRGVLSAADSNMAPTIDVGVQSFTATNPSAPSGYINGDVLNVEATIVNNGVDAYTDGGDVRFFYKANNVKTYVGSTQTLGNFASAGATQTFTGQIDTTSLPSSAYQTTFGVELSNLVADKSSTNNEGTKVVPHDLVPVARKAQVIGNNQIERGDNFLIEAKATFNDGVDTNTSFITFDVEVSLSGMEQWIGGDMIVGGDEVFQEGTSNEHRQYLVKPSMNMGAGDYDIRVRAIDSRMQTSDWQVTERGFTLKNAMPVITAEPVPTVKVQTSTKVSVINNINDAETDLDQLAITSNSPNFVAWHPATEEIEVYFENIRYVSGQPTASGIEIAVNDGTDTAFGTLLFNVIENGQPRWAGVEKQYVDEASSASAYLLPYLSDTDENGNIAAAEDLMLAIVDNTNPELLDVTLNGFTLNYATSDEDINGETTITIRASDGEQYSDQIITIAITPINDAPRLDLSEFENMRLKVNTQKVIFLNEILTDVDGNVNEVTVTASNSVPGAARVSFLDNTLTLIWETAGLQTVTIQTEDRYDSNIYTLVVDVYDSLPLLVGEGPDADVSVSVRDVYVGEVPEVTLFLNKDDVTITSLSSTWQMCNAEYCMYNEVFEHDITMKSLGWTFDPVNGQIDDTGMGQFHYLELKKITAQASNGEKFEFKDSIKWTASESAPGPDSMTEEEVIELIKELEIEIDALKAQIADMEKGTTEYENAVEELDNLETEKEEACEFTTCEEQASSQTTDDSSESGLDLTVVLIVIGVVIVALLAGLMFMRGGNGGNEVQVVDWANQLPANDAVANSMYGGAQEIFQQPVAAVAPAVVQQVPPGAPPLPEGGLPAGWTMEQWAYYGHQYQQ